jgi:hypothetical protein
VGEIGHGLTTMTTPWATNLWAMLNDGAVWGVPRSGMVYRKEEEAKRLVLIERLHYDEAMPWTRESHIEQQADEHTGITKVFAAIGIEVTDNTHSRKVGESERAGC